MGQAVAPITQDYIIDGQLADLSLGQDFRLHVRRFRNRMDMRLRKYTILLSHENQQRKMGSEGVRRIERGVKPLDSVEPLFRFRFHCFQAQRLTNFQLRWNPHGVSLLDRLPAGSLIRSRERVRAARASFFGQEAATQRNGLGKRRRRDDGICHIR
jgi:hypothetical protein